MGKGNELSPEFFIRHGIPSDDTPITHKKISPQYNVDDEHHRLGADTTVTNVFSALSTPSRPDIKTGTIPNDDQLEKLFNNQFDIVQ